MLPKKEKKKQTKQNSAMIKFTTVACMLDLFFYVTGLF